MPKCLNFFDSFDSLEGLCFGCLDSFDCFGSFERCYSGCLHSLDSFEFSENFERRF